MSEKKLIDEIDRLKKSEIADVIKKRIKEFERVGESARFGELCFCLLTANFSAEKCIKIQNEIGKNFSTLTERKLAEELKKYGHRFPNARANYIFNARKCREDLGRLVTDGKKQREKLLDIKGLGMKEASHFLRNIGYKDVAIVDFHIIDLLKREGLVEFDRKKETLSKKKYIEIEKVLEKLAEKVKLNLAELDLYLWYMETGKVLK